LDAAAAAIFRWAAAMYHGDEITKKSYTTTFHINAIIFISNHTPKLPVLPMNTICTTTKKPVV
jgi:hypothetical protein